MSEATCTRCGYRGKPGEIGTWIDVLTGEEAGYCNDDFECDDRRRNRPREETRPLLGW